MEFEIIKNIAMFIAALMTIFRLSIHFYRSRKRIKVQLDEMSNELSSRINWNLIVHRVLTGCYVFMVILSFLILVVLLYPEQLPRSGVLLSCLFSIVFVFWLRELHLELRHKR